MQTGITDQVPAKTSRPKQVVNTRDPDVQTLILEWVVPCLIDDFLNQNDLKATPEMPLESP